MAKRYRKFGAAKFIQVDRQMTPDEQRERIAERNRLVAANPDTRTPAQVWLNDPPPGRSALDVRQVAPLRIKFFP